MPVVTAYKLTNEQQIAACIMYGLACLCFDDTHPDAWWFKWCTDHSAAAPERSLEAAVWWALRHEADGDIDWADAPWLLYVEHVCGNQRTARRVR